MPKRRNRRNCDPCPFDQTKTIPSSANLGGASLCDEGCPEPFPVAGLAPRAQLLICTVGPLLAMQARDIALRAGLHRVRRWRALRVDDDLQQREIGPQGDVYGLRCGLQAGGQRLEIVVEVRTRPHLGADPGTRTESTGLRGIARPHLGVKDEATPSKDEQAETRIARTRTRLGMPPPRQPGGSIRSRPRLAIEAGAQSRGMAPPATTLRTPRFCSRRALKLRRRFEVKCLQLAITLFALAPEASGVNMSLQVKRVEGGYVATWYRADREVRYEVREPLDRDAIFRRLVDAGCHAIDVHAAIDAAEPDTASDPAHKELRDRVEDLVRRGIYRPGMD